MTGYDSGGTARDSACTVVYYNGSELETRVTSVCTWEISPPHAWVGSVVIYTPGPIGKGSSSFFMDYMLVCKLQLLEVTYMSTGTKYGSRGTRGDPACAEFYCNYSELETRITSVCPWEVLLPYA